MTDACKRSFDSYRGTIQKEEESAKRHMLIDGVAECRSCRDPCGTSYKCTCGDYVDQLLFVPVFKQCIGVEGNVGSGKSTLIAGLKGLGYYTKPEPIKERWGTLLNMYFTDPKRWGMALQLEILKWYGQIRKELDGNHRELILERSPSTAYNVFVAYMYDSGVLTGIEKGLLDHYYRADMWQPDVTIYIRTPVEICHERVKARSCNDSGDKFVDLTLLTALHTRHESLYNKDSVKIIDGSQPAEKVLAEAVQVLRQHRY